MAVSKRVMRILRERDEYCWHCGQTEDLVPHHRKNKAMGGSKVLENDIQNIILVCARYNGDMESMPLVQRDAVGWGRKIPFWEEISMPVFDSVAFRWYLLDSEGGKREIDAGEFI